MASAHVDTLRSHGLRVTGPRLAVLDLLDHGSHLSADAIAVAVRERTGAVSTQGVYNVLTDLLDVGLLHRIEPAGSPALYELSRPEKHHHLICRGCSNVIDIGCNHGLDECITPPHLHGFADIEAEIVFWGTCPECQSAAR